MTAEQLAKELTAGTRDGRSAAAQTLASMGEGASPAAVELVACAGDESAGEWCVAALEELGPPPVASLTPLTDLMASNNEAVAYWAATLLGRLGADAAGAVEPLEQAAIRHPALSVSERAVWAIGQIGPSAGRAASTLHSLAKSDNARLARLARKSLDAIGG